MVKIVLRNTNGGVWVSKLSMFLFFSSFYFSINLRASSIDLSLEDKQYTIIQVDSCEDINLCYEGGESGECVDGSVPVYTCAPFTLPCGHDSQTTWTWIYAGEIDC